MTNLLGQRCISQQEMDHLIMRLSIVKCSKAYEKVVLYDDSGRLQPPAGLANQDSEDNTRVTSTSHWLKFLRD